MSFLKADQRFEEPSALEAVVHWVGSNIGNFTQLAQKSGETTAREAIVKARERIANGEDVKKVVSEMRPETMFGFAEEAYDLQAADVAYIKLEETANDYLKDQVKNGNFISVDDAHKAVAGMFADMGAGQSSTFKNRFSEKAGNLLVEVRKYQSQVLQAKGKEDFKADINVTAFHEYQNMQKSLPPDQVSKEFRAWVSRKQTDAQMWGISKDDTTKTILNSFVAELDANPTKYKDPENELFGWTKEKDAAGGFSIAEHAEYKAFIDKAQEAHHAELNALRNEERQADALRKKEYFESFETRLMEAVRSGKTVDSKQFLAEFANGSNDYGQYKYFKSQLDEMNGATWKSDPNVSDRLWEPILNGRDQHIPSREEIDAAYANHELSREEHHQLLRARTAVAEPYFKSSLLSIKQKFHDPNSPDGYVGPQEKFATQQFTTIYNELTEKNGATPTPSEATKLLNDTIKHVEQISPIRYKDQNDFFARTLSTPGAGGILHRDAYLMAFPGKNEANYLKDMETYADNLQAQWLKEMSAYNKPQVAHMPTLTVESGHKPENFSEFLHGPRQTLRDHHITTNSSKEWWEIQMEEEEKRRKLTDDGRF